jgi:teichuronic acid exporter
MFWTGGARLLSQAWTWVITIVVIRLLSPSDYGLLAIAAGFIGVFAMLSEAGFGAALIQAPELDEEKLRRVFGALIVINGSVFLLQVALAPFIAQFFGEERLVWIIRVLALQFLLTIFAAIPSALLSRDLDFKSQSIIALAASVIGSLTSLALALLGYGVWALVISNILVCLCQAVGINIISPFLRRPEFSLRGLSSLIDAGSKITASRILWFFYTQADVFIAGKVLGKELLGFYSIALHLASLPVQRLSGVLNQIAHPAFAEARRSSAVVSFYVLKGVRVLSIVSVPILWGISAIAPEIVAIFLGPKWSSSVVPLQILPLVMPVTLVGSFLNTAFQGIGYSTEVFRNSVTAAVILPVTFCVGVQWGLPGLSVAWLLGYSMVAFLNLRRMLQLVGLNAADLGRATRMAVLSGVLMYACVTILRYILSATLPMPWLAAVMVIAGALCYLAALSATNREGVLELVGLFQPRLRS